MKDSAAETLVSAIRAVHAGQAWVDREITGTLLEELAHRGHTPEGASSQPQLTARESEIEARALRILSLVGLEASARRWAADLVWTERQLVQIARALIAAPKLLLLDEPASGMGAKEMEKVEDIIRNIREMGVTVVVVSHDVKMLMNLSDGVTVLNFGKRIAEGVPEQIQKDPRVLEAYLGTE